MTSKALLVDTGAWLQALAGDEPFATVLARADPIVPALVLSELDWHLRRHRGRMHRVLAELSSGRYDYQHATIEDLARAREIDQKFADLKLGLVDASIAALGERLGVHRLLTVDSDFVSVRFGKRWSQGFELAVPLPPRR